MASKLMRLARPSRSFDHYPNAAHSTLASNFSFSTSGSRSFLGIAGENLGGFLFLWQRNPLETATGAESTASSGRGTVRTSLVLARLMPYSVA